VKSLPQQQTMVMILAREWNLYHNNRQWSWYLLESEISTTTTDNGHDTC